MSPQPRVTRFINCSFMEKQSCSPPEQCDQGLKLMLLPTFIIFSINWSVAWSDKKWKSGKVLFQISRSHLGTIKCLQSTWRHRRAWTRVQTRDTFCCEVTAQTTGPPVGLTQANPILLFDLWGNQCVPYSICGRRSLVYLLSHGGWHCICVATASIYFLGKTLIQDVLCVKQVLLVMVYRGSLPLPSIFFNAADQEGKNVETKKELLHYITPKDWKKQQ